MHYYDNEFGINGKMTIQTLDPTKQKVIGRRQKGENGVSSVSNFIIQLARFAAGCYIKMATSSPLAHEYKLVGG